MTEITQNLILFIDEQKIYFKTLNTGIVWEDDIWDVKNWLFHRGVNNKLVFITQFRSNKKTSEGVDLPLKSELPLPYQDFVKAMAVYLQKIRGSGFMAIRNYVNECRRIHIFMSSRGENSPAQLTTWHFEKTTGYLNDIGYKNIYDAASNLQVIADVIDRKKLTEKPLHFKHGIHQVHNFHDYTARTDISDDEQRKGEEKLPTYEAMQAYAMCTNKPTNNDEEILLRTIDLLIAMGQRGNEVALLPLDCWVEKPVKNKSGCEEKDFNGNLIKSVGIRYYAEKQFQSRIHWLADQDIPFAKRAVDRLKELTSEIREIAIWQESNPGKLWNIDPDKSIDDDTLIKYLGFNNVYNLHLYLERKKVRPVYSDENESRPYFRSGGRNRRYIRRNYYSAGEIENLFLKNPDNHIVLKEKTEGKWKIILKTSEVLSIRFDGAFRFKRASNTFKVLPGRILLKEINGALGSVPHYESVFERRNLTEADGSKIQMTSHAPRHWRNTLYELAGMSNVQQALALGRQNIDQNPTYQHTNLKERTSFHKEFLSFNSPGGQVKFVQDGIRNKTILGDITNTYHFLKSEINPDAAEAFLKTHGLAIHLTPFGGCTHDFSQAPCTKHLQCWNGCSHLHRTNTPGEKERIEEQLELSKEVLLKMEIDSDEFGHSVWKEDLLKKIENLERSLLLEIKDSPTPVFPEGKPFTLALNQRKSSSVNNE